jgi:hypothetical protein
MVEIMNENGEKVGKKEITEKSKNMEILYVLSKFITNLAIENYSDFYDNFFEEIIKHATFQNYEEIIDNLIKKIENKLDSDITFYGFDFEVVKELLLNERVFYKYDFNETTAQEFIERNKDTIVYMYKHDFLFCLKENLKNDIEKKLDV